MNASNKTIWTMSSLETDPELSQVNREIWDRRQQILALEAKRLEIRKRLAANARKVESLTARESEAANLAGQDAPEYEAREDDFLSERDRDSLRGEYGSM